MPKRIMPYLPYRDFCNLLSAHCGTKPYVAVRFDNIPDTTFWYWCDTPDVTTAMPIASYTSETLYTMYV